MRNIGWMDIPNFDRDIYLNISMCEMGYLQYITILQNTDTPHMNINLQQIYSLTERISCWQVKYMLLNALWRMEKECINPEGGNVYFP